MMTGRAILARSCFGGTDSEHKCYCRGTFGYLSEIPLATIAAATVRANQLPRVVSRADAFLPSMVSVNMPSRLRSATVIPEMRLSQMLAGPGFHTPCCL